MLNRNLNAPYINNKKNNINNILFKNDLFTSLYSEYNNNYNILFINSSINFEELIKRFTAKQRLFFNRVDFNNKEAFQRAIKDYIKYFRE